MSQPVLGWTPDLPAIEPDLEQHFPLGQEARYTQRLSLDERNRVVEWAVIQSRRVDGEWRRVAVYDVCHGKGVHVHHYNRRGIEFIEHSLMAVESYADLDAGLALALDRVANLWEENERRSDNGR